MPDSTPLAWDIPPSAILSITVGPEHLDHYNHVNNAVYPAWLEQAGWTHSAMLGFDFAGYQRLGTGCVVHRHEIDYLAAAHLGDELKIGTWIGENDRRISMWRNYQIIRPADGRTLMRARTKLVCIDMVSGRARRMPAAFADAYVVPPEVVIAAAAAILK